MRGETVTHIFVTHTHRDHSPACRRSRRRPARWCWRKGRTAPSRALHVGEGPRLDASNDTDFRPDRALADGEIVQGDGWTLEAVATPGHTANHMAYAFREANVLFSGDHVMAWSTPVVAPARRLDGRLHGLAAEALKARASRSISQVTGLRCRTRRASSRPISCTARRARPRSSTGCRRATRDIPTLVSSIYIGLDPRLTKAAGMSVLAHLEDLVARGAVATDGPASIAGHYRLAVG